MRLYAACLALLTALILTSCLALPAVEPAPAISVTHVAVIPSPPGPTPTLAPALAATPDWPAPALFNFVGHSTFDGIERAVAMPVFWFSPQQVEPDERYPLIIMLHGAGLSSDDVLSMESPTLPDPLLAEPDRYASFYALPLIQAGHTWWEIPDVIAAFALDMAAHFPVDPNRIILMGYSMGGAGVASVAAACPEPFAAFVTLAGFWPYQGRQFRDPEALCQSAGRPFYILHGEADNDIPWQQSLLMVNVLRDVCGSETVIWQRLPNTTHLGAHEEGRHSAELYEWIFEQERPRTEESAGALATAPAGTLQ